MAKKPLNSIKRKFFRTVDGDIHCGFCGALQYLGLDSQTYLPNVGNLKIIEQHLPGCKESFNG